MEQLSLFLFESEAPIIAPVMEEVKVEKEQQLTLHQPLTNEDKIRLIREGSYSAERFLEENQKMIWTVLNTYKRGKILTQEDEQDLYSMGLGGLWLAIQQYDPTRGVKFSTVAWRFILTELQRYYRDIQPHNFHGKTALSLSFSEYDFIEGVVNPLDHYQIDLNEIKLTAKQKEWFMSYIEHRNFNKVAELYGVSKQAVRESVKQTQAKLRLKYR